MRASQAGPGRRAAAVAAAAVLAGICLPRDASADVYYRMLFERALFLMETRIEPLDAIPIFQEIIGRHGDDRPYAARAQLYIGLCYKRAGSDLAGRAFREVLERYPEQSAVREIAEAELGGLTAVPAGSRSGPGAAAARLVRRFDAGQRIGGLYGDGRYAALLEMGTDGLILFDRTEGSAFRLDRGLLAGSASGFPEEAAVSPDGTRIVYSWRHDNGEIALRSVRVDGTGARALFSDPTLVGIHLAGWDPAGERVLAVERGPRAATRAAFISAADGSADPVMDLGTRWPGRMLPSPDGRYVAYSLSEDPADPEGDIFLFGLNDRKTVPLVRQAGDDRLLAWTPDGQGIIYAGGGPETAGLWLLAVRNGRPLPPARWIAEETRPLDPIGLSRDGSLYFRVVPGPDGASRAAGARHELWVWPRFLPGRSRVLTVPDAFPTVRAAVAAANAGDTVLLRPGTYREAVVIGKPLNLQGEDRRTTEIVGSGAGSVVRITSGDVRVSGITVSGGADGIEIAAGPAVRRVVLQDVAAVRNTRSGILSAKTGGYHRIEGCTVSDNGDYGMNVHQFLRSVIRDCDVFRNGTGLRPAWSWHILVEGNRVHHNSANGLLIDSCYNGTVSGNLIHANGGAGISIYYIAGRNTIKENSLVRNRAGVDISLHWGGFGENRFYHNDLVENREQVRLWPASESRYQIWDMGGSGGGNFWSDHPARTAGGIGSPETAYELAGGARDRHPLAEPRFRIRAEAAVDPVRRAAAEPGEWLTIRIELPAGLPLEDIDLASLRLNGSVAPDGAARSGGDADKDGIPELEALFFLADHRGGLEAPGAGREAVVTGKLKNGLLFEARQVPAGGDR